MGSGFGATDIGGGTRRHRRLWPVVAALLLVVAALTVAGARPGVAAPPADFQTSLIVGDGLDSPSGFELAPDGRIFILERTGKIKIVKNGQLLPTPFADLPSEATGDRGLIGIAFDPDFGVANHYVYFYYTGHDLLNHLVRFDASEDVGQEGPYQLFQTTSPSQLLHVGGSIRFGPDGKLYFAVGDNGAGENAQDLSNPHGKILRINPDGSVPTDNPFYGQPGKLGAIWAYGFRNPWRFQFDSATGQLYVSDVGDFTWEELDRVVKGGNYGWPLHEGACTSNCAGFTDPIYAYNHNGASASVTGGPVYRGGMFPPEYQGNLFFGDYARGFIKRAVLDAGGNVTSVQDFDTTAGAVVDMKIAPDGSMYYLDYYPGALYRVVYNTTSHVPIANASADVTKGVDPLTVNFSSAGSNDPDGDALSYSWDFGDGTTSTDANPVKTYPNKGVYTARLTVTANGDHSLAQPIVIQVGLPPTLRLAAPVDGATYRAGDTITWNAYANDAAGFDINDANITTVVRLHHGTHYHPFLGPVSGRAGTFTIPVTGEPSADTSYEVTVTATDANGLYTSQTVSVYPLKSHITLDTSPAGLPLYLDGIPETAPYTVQGVIGFQRLLNAPLAAVAADGTPLQFAGWSDGRGARHTITTPETDTTYTATYRPVPAFTAQYFDNRDLDGAPVLTRQDQAVDFTWFGGSPDPAVPVDGFSARWTKTQYFSAGRYQFSTITDDGVRLYLDGRRVIDHWQGQSSTEYDYVVDLGAGDHTIRMDYFEGSGDATARLSWQLTPDQPDDTYHAQYWNMNGAPVIPSTSPTLARDEVSIDHDWGDGSPGPGIGTNLFLARWTRTLSLAPGDYDFSVTADDGVRLTIDGVLVIDKWIDEGPTTYSVQLPMDGSPHTIVMDYYESGGGAVAKFHYTQLSDAALPPAYHAEFWNTPDGGAAPAIPTTTPDLVRDDPELDFNWYDGSPGAPIGNDHFVARWTRTDTLSAGTYRFSGTADDGIRVYVDNAPVVDMWSLQHATYSVDKVLSAGPHTIRVEYFEAGSGAQVSLDYQRTGPVVPSEAAYSAEYFDNQDLSGTPVLTREDATLDFNWGTGSPGDGVPADHFSARWTRSVPFDAGSYTFTVTSDDGVRLYVDGVKVLDKWTIQSATQNSVTRQLSAGTHQIVLEYFDSTGGALLQFGYQASSGPPPPPPVPFAAEYFANPDLSGTPVLTRTDDAVDFDWGSGSPDPAVPADLFSARWTRARTYDAGTYRFTATGDDGIRVLVDGAVVINGWSDHSPTTYTADLALDAGAHTVVVEYYDRTGGAVARFSEGLL
ncbi:MAG TPA: PA14 domain-containing protein [Rugosimonospora sp.]|nr:PA14 domain-containing protein [Rugosimonospora sp.]